MSVSKYIPFWLILLSTTAQAQIFKALIPDEAIAQYAGSIGYFSAGAGYDIFANKKGRLDFHYGYVPQNKGGKLNIATVKFAYKPWEIGIGKTTKFYPLNPGIFLSYTFHKELSFNFDTEQYPKDYYYWSEALRPHLSVSTEVDISTAKLFKTNTIKKLGVYIEANTNDYYLVNYFQNMSALTITDVFQLGLGLRVRY
ncbi:hypothetical protein [Pedobacter deserti]|uniref:hypothetical protein n=1 Tax=Pedobacter deserti TaxID=2817382 RepID=UPI00210A7389|nr:hypothetical protein [Pedobacter sp. SYSU D00382]